MNFRRSADRGRVTQCGRRVGSGIRRILHRLDPFAESNTDDRSKAVQRTRDRDSRIVALRGLLDDRKAESTAVARRSGASIEAFEHPAALAFRNADAAVFDSQEGAAFLSASYRHRPARIRIA